MFELPEDIWQVRADKSQLDQVLANLVINAKQAMPNGGTLEVIAENISNLELKTRPDLTGGFIKLTLRDQGTGIAEDLLSKVFDPYFTTKQAGSGLGLAISHSIIRKHKGHICVASTAGNGATFTVYLPADHTRCPGETDDQSVSLKSPPFSGHVLLMDDEPLVRNVGTSLLNISGFTVETANHGEEALEKYTCAQKDGRQFDLVIMDLTIPGGMGGIETIKKLLAINPEIKAIVASGYSNDPVVAEYQAHGFVGRLVKPFQLQELKQEIKRVFGY